MSGDGVGGQNNGTDGVVNEKNQKAEKEIQFAKEMDEKCIILYSNLKIVLETNPRTRAGISS